MLDLICRLAFGLVMIALIVVAADPYASGFVLVSLVSMIAVH